MPNHEFDRHTQLAGATGTRRSLLRVATGLVAALASGGTQPRRGRAADDVPPPPPASFHKSWPACSADRGH